MNNKVYNAAMIALFVIIVVLLFGLAIAPGVETFDPTVTPPPNALIYLPVVGSGRMRSPTVTPPPNPPTATPPV